MISLVCRQCGGHVFKEHPKEPLNISNAVIFGCVDCPQRYIIQIKEE